MKLEQACLRIGCGALIFALFLRLFGGGIAADWRKLSQNPSLASILLYAGTGKVFSFSEATEPDSPPEETEPTQEPAPIEPPVFSPSDAALISIKNQPGYEIDVPAMLLSPLSWDLSRSEPTVLILHSHTCESYENTEGYTPSDPYRTQDSRYNMVSIGSHLAACLEAKGIGVIHDTTVYDYPSYNDAYTLSRQAVKQYLEDYPSIRLVLDIHRDAYEDSSGNQASDTVTIGDKTASRLMLVAGTGPSHTNWRENLSLAVKLQAVLEKEHPGVCRDVTMRTYYFNQDLSPGMLLVEVGTAGDTRQDALCAAELLADAIATLAPGTQPPHSSSK